MLEPTVAFAGTQMPLPLGTDRELRDKRYAVFVPPERGMSHTCPTLQDVGPLVLLAPAHATERRSGVSVVAPVVLELDAEFWPFARHFAAGSLSCGSWVQPSSRQPVRHNKTIGLVTRGRV